MTRACRSFLQIYSLRQIVSRDLQGSRLTWKQLPSKTNRSVFVLAKYTIALVTCKKGNVKMCLAIIGTGEQHNRNVAQYRRRTAINQVLYTFDCVSRTNERDLSLEET